jgi:hypothetical protein
MEDEPVACNCFGGQEKKSGRGHRHNFICYSSASFLDGMLGSVWMSQPRGPVHVAHQNEVLD